MGKLVRAERDEDGCRQFIVAGEHGAVEMRESPNYFTFHVHSPVYRPDVAWFTVQATRHKSSAGLAVHPCRILEGGCWTGLTYCSGYDFDQPDVEEVVQWEALEGLYAATFLNGARR